MHGIAEWIENGSNVRRDIIMYRPQIPGRHHQVLCKCAITTATDTDGLGA